MSMFKKLFGGGGKPSTKEEPRQPPPAPQRFNNAQGSRGSGVQTSQSVQMLDQKIHLLEMKEKHLETKIDAENTKAKQFLEAKKRQAAMNCLKRRKMIESTLDQLSKQKLNLQMLQLKLENAAVAKEVTEALSHGNQAIKQAYGNQKVEDFEDLMNDVSDTMQDADEIGQALAQEFQVGEPTDEDDLMNELMELEQEQLDEKMLGVGAPSRSVGQKAPARKEPSAADELAALEASLGATESRPAKQESEKEPDIDDELKALEAQMAM